MDGAGARALSGAARRAHAKRMLEARLAARPSAATAARELDRERWLLYFQMIRAALSEAARKAFQMLPQGAQFIDESLRQSFEKGRAEGAAVGEARAVLRVLDVRGLAVSDAQRERILAAVDLETLDRWVRKAVTASSTDALFE